jgi:hypothetical protein
MIEFIYFGIYTICLIIISYYCGYVKGKSIAIDNYLESGSMAKIKEFNVKKIDAMKFSTEGILVSASCFLHLDTEEIEGNYKEVILVKEDGTSYVIKKEIP